MHSEMLQLYALHEVDARLLHLDRTLLKLDNGENAAAALNVARADLERASDALKHSRVTLGVAESALKANEEKQKQLTKRLYGGTVVNTREAEAVEHEIQMLKAAANGIETTMLETMDAIESGEKTAAAYTQSVAAREAVLAATLAAYARDSAKVKAMAAETLAKRAAAAEPVSAPTMARYDSARRRTKDTGIAVVDGHMCEGCHMQLPSVSILQLRNGTEIINCDNCSRILFWRA